MFILDYVIVGVAFVGSVGIGIYFSMTGGKQKTTKEYHLGDRKMGLIPVTISATVSFISTLTLLGYPEEMYRYGTLFATAVLGQIVAAVVTCFIFVPVLYPLKIVSINEYLRMRFDKYISGIGSVVSVLTAVIWNGASLYGPAIAINAATGLSSTTSILVTGICTLLYTSIGGYKAVVWTDVYQALIMVVGMIMIATQCLTSIGSMSKVWELNLKWDRVHFFNMNPDPFQRFNTYGLMMSSIIVFLQIYGFSQNGVQRYISLPTLNRARISILLIIPLSLFFKLLSCLVGVAIFAYYANIDCDPKFTGALKKYNQIVPYFVTDVKSYSGFVGIFIACAFASSVSSISSTLNAISAMIWNDGLKPLLPNIKEIYATIINKIIVFLFGFVIIGVAILVNFLGGSLIQILITATAGLSGATAALFFIAVFIPWVHNKAVFFAWLTGCLIGTWLGFGSFMMEKNWQHLPMPYEGCPNNISTLNTSLLFESTSLYTSVSNLERLSELTTNNYDMNSTILNTDSSDEESLGFSKIYTLSFLLYKPITMAVTMLTAMIYTLIFGRRDVMTVDRRLVHSCIASWYKMKETRNDLTREEIASPSKQENKEEKDKMMQNISSL